MAIDATQSIHEPRHGLAVASLVLGMISLLLFCVPWISVPAALAAIVMGAVIRHRGPHRVGSDSVVMATVGVICGGVAITLIVVILLIAAITGAFYEQQHPTIVAPPRRVLPQPYEPRLPAAPPMDDSGGYIVTPREMPVQRAGVAGD